MQGCRIQLKTVVGRQGRIVVLFPGMGAKAVFYGDLVIVKDKPAWVRLQSIDAPASVPPESFPRSACGMPEPWVHRCSTGTVKSWTC